MADVVPMPGHDSRCGDCRHRGDCPLTDASGRPDAGIVNSRTRIVHACGPIQRAGERVDAVHRIRSGWVKTVHTGDDGDEYVTGFHGPGAWLGLDALGGDCHRSDAVALDTVSVCAMPLPQLREHLHQSRRATRLVIAAVGAGLASSERQQSRLARNGAARRMAGFLVDLRRQCEAAGLDGDRIELPMSRGEIASYLALAVETVSRLLTRLQRAGIIAVGRHHLRILDHAGLASAAGREPPSGARRSTAQRIGQPAPAGR